VPYKTKGELFNQLNRGMWNITLVEMNSRHKITQMAFYRNGNQKVIGDCVNAVFTALNYLFKTQGIDLVDLYVAVSPDGYYTPFRGAVYAHKNVGDLSVKLSDYEIYNCKNNKWSVYEYNYTNLYYIKGYILKTIEIEIRKALGGKMNLNQPKINEVSAELRGWCRTWNQVKEWRKKMYELLKSKEFIHTIAHTTKIYCETANIIVKDGAATEIKPVEIDLSKLDKIREEHEATAKKLIIEEQLEKDIAMSSLEPEQPTSQKQTEESSGFTGLVSSLNKDETALLVTFLKSEQIPANCELLIESINKKALAVTSDNIIGYVDGIPYIYEEYEYELKISLGGSI
jgi:hypothetical protein